MSNLRVEGYDDIVFWQEDGIGVIVIKSSAESRARIRFFEEIIMALTAAATDENVRAVAITGMNRNFLKEVVYPDENSIKFRENLTRLASAYLSLIYTMEKNVYTLLNGDSTDIGMEIALSGDVVIASASASLGYSRNWKFCCGGSLTSLRFPALEISQATAGKNCDIVFQSDTFLDESKKFIQRDYGYSRFLMRRRRMDNLRIALLEEKEEFLRSA
ncbi:MAG: enoyl-CoA hydratase-related protein [Candidatus Thermoplasmatota archaeon]|jgi:enoyl-CoA hydratase/carnithine racemase|nr:enoyl-CoA hydratase-related protein [Candidatus Thermoplasmatota archaeon]MCL5793730.1 enoyl-CoA hydratase-related protein [Candidatus Thermoplasmatota archaeon]